MFQDQIIAITPDWPAWVFITIHLATGFIITLFAIRDGCESPAGTLMFGTLFGGLAVAVLIIVSPLIILYGVFAVICALLGIEAG